MTTKIEQHILEVVVNSKRGLTLHGICGSGGFSVHEITPVVDDLVARGALRPTSLTNQTKAVVYSVAPQHDPRSRRYRPAMRTCLACGCDFWSRHCGERLCEAHKGMGGAADEDYHVALETWAV